MTFNSIVKFFVKGNTLVFGLRGRGKDMLFANVVARRKLPYMSNTDYGGLFIPYDYKAIDCGGNTYDDFIQRRLKRWECPLCDTTDVYLADCGVYFPSQYNNQLDRKYPNLATFMALSRHVNRSNVHVNCQSLDRIYLKLREQSDVYIRCEFCRVFGRLVFQKVTIYDKYESAVNGRHKVRQRVPLFANSSAKMQAKIFNQRQREDEGFIRTGWLIYVNRSDYDTRVFKRMLKEGDSLDS